MAVTTLDQLGNVRDRDRRVGERLEVQKAGVVAERRVDGVRIGDVNEGRFDAEAAEARSR